jgi:hypothetical protein
MDLFDARFLIESERRREEVALAAQHLMVKEAQRAGMKIPPLLSLRNVNISPIAMALAHGLDWLGHLFAVWSCRLQSRYASFPFGVSPENQSDPCSS